jgi:hypothetical protein
VAFLAHPFILLSDNSEKVFLTLNYSGRLMGKLTVRAAGEKHQAADLK